MAHGIILTALYLPVALLLVGLILRGVAFDFRAKVPVSHKPRWNRVFFAGSLIASLAQGYMLGVYVLGLDPRLPAIAFGALVALCLAAAYAAMGAAWLIYKTEGELQKKAVRWLRGALVLHRARHGRRVARHAARQPAHLRQMVRASPSSSICRRCRSCRRLCSSGCGGRPSICRSRTTATRLLPFLTLALIFALGFAGLAWSFYPFVVPDRLTIWQAASAPESLAVILVGTVFVLPVIIGASFFVYRVFSGKATELHYD